MIRRISVIIIAFGFILNLFGCYNYLEPEAMAITMALAIDKGEKQRYLITAETINLRDASSDKAAKPIYISAEGDTILDALRNMVNISGHKLYVGRCHTVIISQEIAKKGILPILNFSISDSEPPLNATYFISMEDTAKELFKLESIESMEKGLSLNLMLKSNKALPKAIDIKIPEIANRIAQDGISLALPAVGEVICDDKPTLAILGTAVFIEDRLLGFIDGENTMFLMFVLDMIKGGILPVKDVIDQSSERTVTLEILESKTKVKPVFDGEDVSIDIDIKTTVALDGQESTMDYDKVYNLHLLEDETGMEIKQAVENIVKVVQEDFGSDIFGFGERIKKSNLKFWNRIKDDWEKGFKNLKVNVKTEVIVNNSGVSKQPLVKKK